MTELEQSSAANGAVIPTVNQPGRWDPFAELESWLGRTPLQRLSWPGLWNMPDGVDFTPLADIEETDKAWTIDIELPGVAKSDVEVESHGRTVVIRGERKQKERTGILRQRRRVTGTFRYEVTLPGDIDTKAIEAKLDNGELVLTIPKAAADQAQKIKVN